VLSKITKSVEIQRILTLVNVITRGARFSYCPEELNKIPQVRGRLSSFLTSMPTVNIANTKDTVP
jgi:hypothetical protein